MSLDVSLYIDTGGDDPHCVFDANITHNLNTMANQAGIYKHLWRPEELGIVFAGELISPLRIALKILNDDPSRFKAFNPDNGWGDYDCFVALVKEYLEACVYNPKCFIHVSR